MSGVVYFAGLLIFHGSTDLPWYSSNWSGMQINVFTIIFNWCNLWTIFEKSFIKLTAVFVSSLNLDKTAWCSTYGWWKANHIRLQARTQIRWQPTQALQSSIYVIRNRCIYFIHTNICLNTTKTKQQQITKPNQTKANKLWWN